MYFACNSKYNLCVWGGLNVKQGGKAGAGVRI